MLGIRKKNTTLKKVSLDERNMVEEDEFQIPTLVLCKTPSPEEMERRKRISSLRRQCGIRIEDTNLEY